MFLSLKNDVNVPSKSNKQKKLCKIRFLLASWRSVTKNSRVRIQDPDPLVTGVDPRIRIHPKMSWIRNTVFKYGYALHLAEIDMNPTQPK